VTGGNASGSFATSTGAFTAPQTGLYSVSWETVVSSVTTASAGTFAQNGINVNGIAKTTCQNFPPFVASTAQNLPAQTSSILVLNAGDVVQVTVQAGIAGTLLTSVFPAASLSNFAVYSLF
jgi:hypothetical protein